MTGDRSVTERSIDVLRPYPGWIRTATSLHGVLQLLDGTLLTDQELAATRYVATMFGPPAMYAFARAAMAAGDRSSGESMRASLTTTRAELVCGPVIDAALALHDGRVADAGAALHGAIEAQWAYRWDRLVPDILELASVFAHRTGNDTRAAALAGSALSTRESTGVNYRYLDQQGWFDEVLAAVDTTAVDNGRRVASADALRLFERGRGEHRRAVSGWDALTVTEAAVVDLVVQGLTNPQIATELLMGRETVKTHLSNVYAKLGVVNRTQLTAAHKNRPGRHVGSVRS